MAEGLFDAFGVDMLDSLWWGSHGNEGLAITQGCAGVRVLWADPNPAMWDDDHPRRWAAWVKIPGRRDHEIADAVGKLVRIV